ncbi:hypothetical protein ACFORO_08420 [Amycolatopsis halotolerans]|uniref:Uncharacterized protein n=1 Tax=Amycolatopsis halotolerans TaxID=330083 RepID=A0ABV7QA59_9PSEU
MKLSIIDTLTGLAAVYRRLPRVLVELIAGQLTADELREFGDLLAEAAELVCEHAASARDTAQLRATESSAAFGSADNQGKPSTP